MAIWPPSAEDLIATNKKLQEENRRLREPLRDQFASAALTGLLSDSKNILFDFDTLSKQSYEAADAMLKARDDK